MRIKETIMTVGVIALSLSTMTGMVHSSQFQRAAAVETSGFDALAHDIFGSGSSLPAAKAVPGAHGE